MGKKLVKLRKNKLWAKKTIYHCTYRQLGFSSEIEVSQLGTARNLFNSAQLRNLQLELITSIYSTHANDATVKCYQH